MDKSVPNETKFRQEAATAMKDRFGVDLLGGENLPRPRFTDSNGHYGKITSYGWLGFTILSQKGYAELADDEDKEETETSP